MSARPPGWYWVKRLSGEEWQPARWAHMREYPGEWRWEFFYYRGEIHRGRVYRIGKCIHAPA